jgi:lipoprotein-releasing system permease protein
MFLILTMIVLVAALNIVSGLIMLVKDKGQDIAILRTWAPRRARSCGYS